MPRTLDLSAAVVPVGSGAIAVYSDVSCPWATIVLHRLRRARERLGMTLSFDLRPFPLELVNRQATDFDHLNREMPAAASVLPDYGFRPWDDSDERAVTTLPALEAIRACYAQTADAADQLDGALRRAFFADHRCISLFHVILDIADSCDLVDTARLDADLRRGRARHEVFDHWEQASELGVVGSPHIVLSNGDDTFAPSLEVGTDDGRVVVVEDRPQEIDDLLVAAAQAMEMD